MAKIQLICMDCQEPCDGIELTPGAKSAIHRTCYDKRHTESKRERKTLRKKQTRRPGARKVVHKRKRK